jgi:hypothetical protein
MQAGKQFLDNHLEWRASRDGSDTGHVLVQTSSTTCHARIGDVMAAAHLPATMPEKHRLLDVRNHSGNTMSADIDAQSRRPTIPTHTAMSTMTRQVVAALSWIAALPLARADDGEAGGLIVGSSGGEIAVRGYGAAQLMRDNPWMGTVALVAATFMVCGSAYGLVRSSMSTDGPSVLPHDSIGATVMSACQNLIAEIPDPQSVSFRTLLAPQLQNIDNWTDQLIAMVDSEIDGGTQAASLEQMRECIDSELMKGALRPFRSRLELLTRHLQRSGFGVDPRHLPAIRKKFNESIRLANGINEKLRHGISQLTSEINRQHARPIPRIG